MESQVVIDWKFMVALGSTVVAIIFISKLDLTTIKEISIHMIDTSKECLIAKL